MSLGSIMMDLRGLQLEPDERELLQHPLVGGIILFSRNFADVEQLQNLTREIHSLRNPPLLIAVDHEGGRVQRFRQGFCALPPCHSFGELYDQDHHLGLAAAEKAGWLMAVELLSVGVDFSFAPVLDVDRGISQVIGDRAFHSDPETVANLAKFYTRGMKRAGMAAIGKHFPGHGSVKEDSHHAVPVDKRRYEDVAMLDMIPFERLLKSHLQGIMPAHVIFSQVDDKPAGFSVPWLQGVLRQQLGFQGTIFSDDISMAGAEALGNYTQRAEAAITAGCDMVLICNNQDAAIKVLQTLEIESTPASQVRLIRMHGRKQKMTLSELHNDTEWLRVSEEIMSLEKTPELGFGDDEIHT
ncbi:MAG: beta-N-acetylhexosaminidase [Gammaproteobacteria bacterium]|jgi:beta-N-acetylhexosaminidase|nr:beta-N-acetylhexosaminidase [Gammaproteobacteria bacterium]